MFQFNLKEYQIAYSDLSSYTPWYAIVAPGIVLNEDESLMKTYTYRGRDLDSATKTELMIMSGRVNNILKRFGEGWCFYVEARRSKAETYVDRTFPDKACQMLDYERQNHFNKGTFYVNTFYFTLQWLPPSSKKKLLSKLWYVSEGEEDESFAKKLRENIDVFQTECNKFFDAFSSEMYSARPLSDKETLTYLHSCVSLKDYDIELPSVPVGLADSLCDTPFYGGIHPVFGDEDGEKMSIYSIRSYPEYSFPGLLDELNRLGIEYRWVSRFICFDKQDSLDYLFNRKRTWKGNDKDLITMVKEMVTKEQSVLVNSAALERCADADAASVEVTNDYVSFGDFTSHIIVRDANDEALKWKERLIDKAYQNVGFVVRKETHNATSAFLGTIPGNAYADPRRDRISTKNLCDVLPLSCVWEGNPYCEHLDSPAIAQVETVGSTPFFLNLHVGDVGHTMIVGPTGSGKSVLLNFLETQIRSVPDARIYVFDKGGSSRVLAAAVGGIFYDLGNESSTHSQSFQPLRYVDDENERIWASEWLQELFVQEGVTLTPKVKADIWSALESISANAYEDRTLSSFLVYVQNFEIRNALKPYVIATKGISDTQGPYGRLFDSDSDTLKLIEYQSFEMGQLMNKRNAVVPTLSYLFHRIEKKCHGEPTFIILDECWTFLDNPVFVQKIREWLKTMRKNNVSIIFATQNLEDIRKSSISSAIIESCMTKIFLPNPQAISSANDDIYNSFGLNWTERNIIAQSAAKHDYYYSSIHGRRLFSLALSPYALSFIASSSKEDQEMCELIKTNYPDDDFFEHWLKFKGQDKALSAYRSLVLES